ncbi:hypothetical protein YC2023_115171 [Brassica napus]
MITQPGQLSYLNRPGHSRNQPETELECSQVSSGGNLHRHRPAVTRITTSSITLSLCCHQKNNLRNTATNVVIKMHVPMDASNLTFTSLGSVAYAPEKYALQRGTIQTNTHRRWLQMASTETAGNDLWHRCDICDL